MSIRTKLLLVFTVVFTVAFIIFGGVFYRQFSRFAIDLAKQKLQSDANSVTDLTVRGIFADEVQIMDEERQTDSSLHTTYVDYFREIQANYPDLKLEIRLTVLNEDDQSITKLVEIGTDGTSKPLETLPIADEDEWAVWIEGTQAPLLYTIFEDEQGIWTNSSAPVLDANLEPTGALLDVFIRTDDQLAAVQRQIRDTLLIAAAISYPLLLLAVFIIAITATRALEQFSHAAETLEQGNKYESQMLAFVMKRNDELGQMARVFDKMAIEVQEREEKLKAQVVKLKIEIDFAKQNKDVNEIVESDYFQELKQKKEELRQNRKTASTELPPENNPPSVSTVMDTDDYVARLKKRAQQLKDHDSQPKPPAKASGEDYLATLADRAQAAREGKLKKD